MYFIFFLLIATTSSLQRALIADMPKHSNILRRSGEANGEFPPMPLPMPMPELAPPAHKCSPGDNSPGENKGCCTKKDPCPKHVGDCDADDECQGELKCNLDHKGTKYGYSGRSVNVCGPCDGPAVYNRFNISHVSSVSNMSNGWNMYHHPR